MDDEETIQDALFGGAVLEEESGRGGASAKINAFAEVNEGEAM